MLPDDQNPSIPHAYVPRADSIVVDGTSFESPFNYLRPHFKYPEVLLATMADTGSLLSGSRALNFFKPGSCGPDSDWDFYVPGCEGSVARMMSALILCGIKFNVVWRDVEPLIDSAVGYTMKTTVRDLRDACVLYDSVIAEEQSPITALFDNRLSRNCMRIIQAIYRSVANMLKVGADSRCHADVTVQKTNIQNGELCLSIELFNIVVNGGDENDSRNPYIYYASGKNICVVPGSIPLGAKSVPVQMIIACPERAQGGMRPKSTLDILTKFYGSHVQCFISGWFAGQLFPEYTDRMEAIEWNTDQGPPSQKAKEKYRQRGYSFVTPPESHTTTIKYRSGMRVVPLWGVFSPVDKSQIQGYIEILEKWMRFVSWVPDAEGRLHMIVDTELERARTNADEDVINFTRAVYKSLPSASLPAAMPLSADTIEGSKLVQDLQRSGLVRELLKRSYLCYCL
jgi:hypothetical protein